ncbi:MAG: mechanosensitive ion channel protein MscS [Marinilabiliales bacterium]|nr:MAG: mechanosensitive ion channel protein MscS [Marinilabiliales bacterium]
MLDLQHLNEPLLLSNFKNWLIENFDLSHIQAVYVKTFIFIIAIAILSIIANYVTKKIILTVLQRIILKSKTKWDDVLLEKKVFNNLSHFAPALVIFYSIGFAMLEFPGWIELIKSGVYVYIAVIGIAVFFSFINAVEAIYNSRPNAKNRPIKAYLQVLKVLIAVVATILIVSILFNKNPASIIAGLGVFVTALMFLFKDSLLGLIGGIQLTSNDMVRLDDWISMPSRGADGTVIDITLNTVKVQNWDKTISTIPTYSLMTESFKNWRGMEESGGRRICRSINIDVKSIKFCDDKLVEKFKKIHLIKDYIESRLNEIEAHNKENNYDTSVLVNGRRITNIGTFRIYIEEYLKNHEQIHNDGMTFLVRQLEPSEKGLPLQIYVFSKIQAWVDFEAVQSNIFDHLLAVVPEFELRLFQNPTGEDFQKLMN